MILSCDAEHVIGKIYPAVQAETGRRFNYMVLAVATYQEWYDYLLEQDEEGLLLQDPEFERSKKLAQTTHTYFYRISVD